MSHDPRQARQTAQEEDAAQGQLGDDFADARPLWNAEVNLILAHHVEGVKKEEGKEQAHQQMVQETLNYVRSLNNYQREEAIEEAQGLLLKYPGINRWELAMLNNLRIDDLEECLTLIPTIRQKVEAFDNGAQVAPQHKIDRESLVHLLAELKKYQNS